MDLLFGRFTNVILIWFIFISVFTYIIHVIKKLSFHNLIKVQNTLTPLTKPVIIFSSGYLIYYLYNDGFLEGTNLKFVLPFLFISIALFIQGVVQIRKYKISNKTNKSIFVLDILTFLQVGFLVVNHSNVEYRLIHIYHLAILLTSIGIISTYFIKSIYRPIEYIFDTFDVIFIDIIYLILKMFGINPYTVKYKKEQEKIEKEREKEKLKDEVMRETQESMRIDNSRNQEKVNDILKKLDDF